MPKCQNHWFFSVDTIHYLIVPTKHVSHLSDLSDELWRELKDIVVYMGSEKGLKGYRLIHNSGDAASINHIQVHFLADVTPERAV